MIEQAKQREVQFVHDLKEAEQKFLDEKKEEIEAYQRWEQEKASIDYGNEAEANNNNEEKQPLVIPVFNQADWKAQWLNENPVIVIPEQVIEDKDNDWYMN